MSPKRDWPEVRGKVHCPRTVLFWLLAKWVVGESEEAGRCTLSSHGPENLEEKEIALSLRKWAEQKQNETKDSPPGPPPGEGAVLFSPSPEKEQRASPGCPRQGRFVDFLDDLGPGWDAGGAALLREAWRAGLCVDSAWGGAALEDAGGHPRRRADWGLAPRAAVDDALRRGRMCWIASVCCCTAENCWAKPSTMSPNSPASFGLFFRAGVWSQATRAIYPPRAQWLHTLYPSRTFQRNSFQDRWIPELFNTMCFMIIKKINQTKTLYFSQAMNYSNPIYSKMTYHDGQHCRKPVINLDMRRDLLPKRLDTTIRETAA